MITAIADYLTNKKQIAKAQAAAKQYHTQTDATSANTFGTKPIQVQNEEEARIAANQGLIQDPTNPLMFRSPYYENMQLWSDAADTKVNNATDTYMDYLGNPINTVIDRVADVANLPFSILGQDRFIPDPSAKAEKRYNQALEDNTKIARASQEVYSKKRGTVNKTLSDILAAGKTDETSVIGNINPQDFTPDSMQKFKESLNYADLVLRPKYITDSNKTNWRIYADGRQERVLSMDEVLQDQRNLLTNDMFARASQTFKNQQSDKIRNLKSSKEKYADMRGNLQRAKALIKNAKSAGWGGLFKDLPEADARNLAAILKTIKANMAFSSLKEMRETNPNGSALGQVTELEIELLYNEAQPLDQFISDDLLIGSLDRIESRAGQNIINMEKAYNNDVQYFGGRPAEVRVISKDQQDTETADHEAKQLRLQEIRQKNPKVDRALNLLEQLKANQKDKKEAQ